jgi:hypothetical protein
MIERQRLPIAAIQTMYAGVRFRSRPTCPPWWDHAPFQETGTIKIPAGFCHASGDFTDRISGNHPGGHYGVADDDEITERWARAGSMVQWRRPL